MQVPYSYSDTINFNNRTECVDRWIQPLLEKVFLSEYYDQVLTHDYPTKDGEETRRLGDINLSIFEQACDTILHDLLSEILPKPAYRNFAYKCSLFYTGPTIGDMPRSKLDDLEMNDLWMTPRIFLGGFDRAFTSKELKTIYEKLKDLDERGC